HSTATADGRSFHHLIGGRDQNAQTADLIDVKDAHSLDIVACMQLSCLNTFNVSSTSLITDLVGLIIILYQL
uniref:Uncharacterized protein n=1 Tax=Romanomermis culicivorax TaxID=13658 RepID=A0A915LDH7_ROMCU